MASNGVRIELFGIFFESCQEKFWSLSFVNIIAVADKFHLCQRDVPVSVISSVKFMLIKALIQRFFHFRPFPVVILGGGRSVACSGVVRIFWLLLLLC